MSNGTMADALAEAIVTKELRALREALGALRERLDADNRAVHGRVLDIERSLASAKARIAELENRMYVEPAKMAAIEKSTRELLPATHGYVGTVVNIPSQPLVVDVDEEESDP